MPVIKIREKTEEVVSTPTGQSNAVVIPLFVTSLGVEWNKDKTDGVYYRADLRPKSYTDVLKFEGDYKDFAIRDDSGIFVDKNFYMIEDLIGRGLEVYVMPVDLSSNKLFPSVGIDGQVTEDVIKKWPEYEGKILNKVFDWDARSEIERIDGDVSQYIAYHYYRTGDDIIGHNVSDYKSSKNEVVDLRPVVNSMEDIIPELNKIINQLVLDGFYDELKDKSRFNFKFLTIGAYYNAKGEEKSDGTRDVNGACWRMLDLCASDYNIDRESGRGDCMTVIDIDPSRDKDLFKKDIETMGGRIPEERKYVYKFGFCTYPWVIKEFALIRCKYEEVDANISRGEIKPFEMPGSYAYLVAFAKSIATNADFLAIAGYNRGTVGDSRDLTPVVDLGEIDIHMFQNDTFSTNEEYTSRVIVNPIISCSDGLYRIWGNRVLTPLENETYSDQVKDANYFLNVRQMVCDIKKQCYFASSRVSFEPNNDITWFNFKTIVNPVLENMIANNGLEWYTWKRLTSDVKGKMVAQLTIKPIEAVESFDITVYIRNTDEE